MIANPEIIQWYFAMFLFRQHFPLLPFCLLSPPRSREDKEEFFLLGRCAEKKKKKLASFQRKPKRNEAKNEEGAAMNTGQREYTPIYACMHIEHMAHPSDESSLYLIASRQFSAL